MTGRPTGEQLYQELASAAATARVSLTAFAAPLFPAGDVGWKLEQVRIAQRPLQRTIDRIRALIRGDAFTPAERRSAGPVDTTYLRMTRVECENMGLPPSGRAIREMQSLRHVAAEKERIERLRRFTEQAHHDRRPGQALADRVRELRLEARG